MRFQQKFQNARPLDTGATKVETLDDLLDALALHEGMHGEDSVTPLARIEWAKGARNLLESEQSREPPSPGRKREADVSLVSMCAYKECAWSFYASLVDLSGSIPRSLKLIQGVDSKDSPTHTQEDCVEGREGLQRIG
eukprot:798349-Pelagomonas_calceolata.AAC.4